MAEVKVDEVLRFCDELAVVYCVAEDIGAVFDSSFFAEDSTFKAPTP